MGPTREEKPQVMARGKRESAVNKLNVEEAKRWREKVKISVESVSPMT